MFGFHIKVPFWVQLPIENVIENPRVLVDKCYTMYRYSVLDTGIDVERCSGRGKVQCIRMRTLPLLFSSFE